VKAAMRCSRRFDVTYQCSASIAPDMSHEGPATPIGLPLHPVRRA